jgi:hypothetical protein
MKHLYGCGEDAITCQYDLPLCDLVQDAGTKGYMARGTKKIDELLGDIEHSLESGIFVPNPTPLCHWCNFCPTNAHQPESGKGYCPYYLKWTRENPTFQKQFEWENRSKAEIAADKAAFYKANPWYVQKETFGSNQRYCGR